MTRRDEQGLTLIELVVAVALLAVVTVAATEAFVVTARGSDATSEALAGARGRQRLVALLTDDVRSADAVAITAPAACPTPAGATALVSMRSSAGATTWSAAGPSLLRQVCPASGPTTTSAFDSLDPARPPAVTCDGATCPTDLGDAQPRLLRTTVTYANGDGLDLTLARRPA